MDERDSQGRYKMLDMTKFDAEDLKKCTALAGLGLTNQQVAAYFGMGKSSFQEKIKRYPGLCAAMKKGRASRVAQVSGKLMQLIDGGNLTAIIFYLKTQGRWKEANEHTVFEDDDEEKTVAERLEISTTDPIEASRIYQEFMRRSNT